LAAGSTLEEVAKPWGERRRLNAYRVRYFVWNDRRCAVRWTVEGKCMAKKEYACGTINKEYS
jgi:hypothetical protein